MISIERKIEISEFFEEARKLEQIKRFNLTEEELIWFKNRFSKNETLDVLKKELRDKKLNDLGI